MQPRETTETISPQEQAQILNDRLVRWSGIYNSLRGKPDFDVNADFLLENAILPIYKDRMPRDAKFLVEVHEACYQRLQRNLPRNVEKVDDGKNIIFF